MVLCFAYLPQANQRNRTPCQAGLTQVHARQALEAGLSAAELRQVAALAITSLGFPAAMAGLSWINDILKDEG